MAPHTLNASRRDLPRANTKATLHLQRTQTDGRTSGEGLCYLSHAKKRFKKCGKLPPKEPETIPWHTLCIDLIGPYKFGTGKHQAKLHAMAMIDPATGWFEIVRIDRKRADLL